MLALTLAVTAVTATASAAYAYWSRHRWAERGIHSGRLPVAATAALGVPFGLLLTLLAQPALADLPSQAAIAAAAALGAWAALTTLAIGTDIATTKVPRDACLFASTVGVVSVIAAWNWRLLLAAGVAVFLLAGVALIARVVVGGLGFSDVRILAAAGLTLGWWLPVPYLMYGLIAASVAQIVFRLLAPKRALLAVAEAPSPEESQASQESRVRARPLPFAPALTLGVTGFAVWAARSGESICSFWPGAC